MQTMENAAPGAGDGPGNGSGERHVVAPVHPSRGAAPWPVEFYRSAVGKKWVMAITGIMLMGFVAYHMIGNLHIYEGAHGINEYGEFLREIAVPLLPRTVFLWIARSGLIVAFVLHIHAAYSLTRMNRRAQAGGYATSRDYLAANAASRSMRWTGVIILAYLAFHLADLTWGFVNPDFVRGDVYRNLQASLTNAPVAAIYIIANVALGIHLWHGAWSMFQSLGLNNPKYNAWRRNFAVGFAVLVTVGNLSFPLTIVSGVADDDVCFEEGDRIVSCEDVFADALRNGEFTVDEFDDLSEKERHAILEVYAQNEARRELQEAGE